MSVVIKEVTDNSLAFLKGIEKGDSLISINKNEITDALDYNFYTADSKLKLVIKKANGKLKKIKIKKFEKEDIGLVFETYLMDNEHRCKNKCIFCFIDQLPKGLRDTLYFKDDDSRLSFLFGNYITLTNISPREVERIKKMHISPINISVHTTNPELRVKMMKNPNAGKSLEIMYDLADFGTKINCQLVLCPGINDGKELERTLTDLMGMYPSLLSVSAVPVGLTKYRDGLEKLEMYDKESANEIIEIINKYNNICLEKFGERLFFASDEFFLLAERSLPDYEYYGDFPQIDSGVGSCRLLIDEFIDAVNNSESDEKPRKLSIATGKSFYPMMAELVDKAKEKWHNLDCKVYMIENEFFGKQITVTGLLTGQDVIAQLKNKPLGDKLLISATAFRSQRDMMLDDVTVSDLETQLGVKVEIVENDGFQLLSAILN